MVKILHYVGVMNRAGTETFIMNMFRNLNRNNYKFDFLCSCREKGDYDDEIRALGGQFYYVDLSKRDGIARHVENYMILKKQFERYACKYDVIHIHTYHALDMYIPTKAALDAKFRKVISHSHSNSADGHFFLHEIFKRRLSSLPIVKMACTNEAWEWMFARGDKILINNGIQTQDYKFSKAIRIKKRNEFNLNDEIVIGHVGRFDPVKNHVFLINVFFKFNKKYPTSKLLMIGNGVEMENIKKECMKLGIADRVIFAGVRDDVNELLQAMDVFVFPSIYEGLGIAVIEAEASGLPCLVSDNVPSDVDICYVKHMSLDADATVWAIEVEKAIKKVMYREYEFKNIIDAGYDAKSNCERLMKIYAQ